MKGTRFDAALLRVGARIGAFSGWRRPGFAFAAGCVSAVGFAPIGFFPALLAGFAMLVLLLDGADASSHPIRNAVLCGWAFAFGQYFIGFHWISYAFLVDPSAHLWQMPFALVFLCAGLALYAGIACALAVHFWQYGLARYFTFAVLYTASEWLRGHAFTGFPWNLAGYGWGASLAILQSTALIGVYGLSYFTILFGATLAEIFVAPRNWLIPVAMAVLFTGLWADGAVRLAATPAVDVPGVRLRLVQPDIPQREKLQRTLVGRNWQRLLALSRSQAVIPPTHIIWPEAATPFPLTGYALDEIGLLTRGQRVLIAGAPRVEGTPGERKVYNSLYIVDPDGHIGAVYDKFHLVPFGEYVPFARVLNRIGITKLTAGETGFSTGEGPRTYDIPGAPPVGPLICYEIIFPHAVIGIQRPGWLVNITDDSWFGPWAGPHQHLLAARVRAIEEGIPVARAANTGISAVIDPVGRIVAALGLDRTGVVDSLLPARLAPTPYARFGDLIFLLLLMIGVLTAWFTARS